MVNDYLLQWRDDFGIIRNLDVLHVRVTSTNGANTNIAEITLPSTKYTLDGEFFLKTGESITIYASNDGIINRNNPEVQYLIGTYRILRYSGDDNAHTYTVYAMDMTYFLLSRIWAGDVQGTAPEIVSNIVQTINEDGIEQDPVPTQIQQLRSDGSAFPTIRLASAYRTAFDLLSEISQISNTGDTLPYIFYIDPEGKFIWEFPLDEPAQLELEYGKEPVMKFSHDINEAQKINFVIFDCGEDKNGNAILSFELAENAGTIEGSQHFEPMTDIARDLRYSLGADYDTMDNAEFRDLCIRDGNARAQSIIDSTGRGLRKTTLELRGGKYIMSSLHKLKSNTLLVQNLRVERVVHTMDRHGWRTTVEFLQDPQARESLIV